MLMIYRKTAEGMRTLERLGEDCWVNVVDPTAEERERLEEWDIPPEMITYALDLDEAARTERDNGFTFILLRVPYRQQDADIPYTTIPLGIVVGREFIVTICRIQHPIMEELATKKVRGLTPAKRSRFVLHLFWQISNRYLAHLRQINKTVEQLEDQLQRSTRNHEVLELLKYQKSLVYFTTGLRSNAVVFDRLDRGRLFNQFEEDSELLDDVITENQQAIEMTNIAADILSSMMDAFASIISNNLNAVIKLLAALTIIVNLPTIVASYYGMNVVGLPFADHPLAFWFVLGISLLLTVAAVFVFVKRDWF